MINVSPQSKGRKRKKPKARGRSQPPGPDAVIARIGQGAMRELDTDIDPLDAELCVSDVLGMWWGHYDGPADPEVLLGEGLAAYAARKRRAGAVGLLRAIAVLGTEPQRLPPRWSRAVSASRDGRARSARSGSPRRGRTATSSVTRPR